jgi:hypothetical protein
VLTYRLRDRFFQFAGPAKYPSEAEVSVALEPAVPFGGVAGETRSVVVDRPLRSKFNLSTGRSAVISDAPLFGPLDTSVEAADTTFVLRRNVVTVSAPVSSPQNLADLVAGVFYAFPAALNVYSLDAPYATHAWGRVGDVRFQWLFEPTEIVATTKVTSKRTQEELATRSWRLVAGAANSRRIMGGLIYFHTGCRLLAAGQNRFEFVAETLLNFAKSLQSLFGESRDDVRSGIRDLDLFADAEIEAKLIPTLLLRNEFDVGHVSLALLSRDQLRVLHDYTNLAEEALRKLWDAVLKKLEEGTLSTPPDTSGVITADKEAILETVRQNINPYVSK